MLKQKTMAKENKERQLSLTKKNQDLTNIITIQDLPVEIFLHICSFLDAASLVHGLSLVCKQFYQILTDDSIWKVRINRVWPNVCYPLLPSIEVDDDELFWKLSCVAIERQAKLWKSEEIMENILLHSIHYSTIDGILLIQNGEVCVSGGRDRSLVVSNLAAYNHHNPPNITRIDNAHDGWIWDLAAMDDKIYSCSWDGSIKSWSLTGMGLQPLLAYERVSQGALLCVTSCPELALFATGSYCKTVWIFDPRCGKSVLNYKQHQSPVLHLEMDSKFVLSASEDRTVHVWDQRAGKAFKSVEISRSSFPMSMCLKKDVLYVGDSHSNLHILDPKKDFEPVKKYENVHAKSITGVYADSGCLITSSLDRTVQVSSPTDPPKLITSLQYSNGEIAGIDYLNEVLAVSGADSVEIWRPKSTTLC